MNLTAIDALRLLSGAFLIPHFVFDVKHPREGAKIYEDAGIGFGKVLFRLSLTVNLLIVCSFMFDLWARWVAILAASYLFIAAAIVWTVSRRWLWNFRGFEFLLFWACCCVVIAVWGA